MILKELFETKLTMFEHLSTQQDFNLTTKKGQDSMLNTGPERVKIVDPASPFEPTIQPKSYWKNVICQPATRHRPLPSEMP